MDAFTSESRGYEQIKDGVNPLEVTPVPSHIKEMYREPPQPPAILPHHFQDQCQYVCGN